MKKKLLSLIPYVVILAINFYLLPLLSKNTGMAILTMLLIMPLITFLAALIYAYISGFSIFLPLVVVLLFLPSVFIFYNESAYVYIVVYGIISIIGDFIGHRFYKKRIEK